MGKLTLVVVLGFGVACACADWYDNFDSYTPGSIYNQGGWTGWGGVPSAAGTVTNAMSLSSPYSQEISLANDSVHTYSGYNTGVWWYTARVWIPSDFQSGGTSPETGTYFILLNSYTSGGSDTRWSVQFAFDSLDQMIHADAGSSTEVTLPYVADEWSTIAVRIDLDNDWTQIYYDGTLIDDPTVPDDPILGGGYRWTLGVFGNDTGGALNIAAVDLYANYSSSVYYDDMSLAVPEPVSGLLALALLLVMRRR
jgi:hypothetical protein